MRKKKWLIPAAALALALSVITATALETGKVTILESKLSTTVTQTIDGDTVNVERDSSKDHVDAWSEKDDDGNTVVYHIITTGMPKGEAIRNTVVTTIYADPDAKPRVETKNTIEHLDEEGNVKKVVSKEKSA